MGGITYPLLSDFFPHGQVAQQYGVLRTEGYAERAIYVIDKRGIIRYVDVHDIDEQPDNEVLFRVLEGVDPVAAAAYRPVQKTVEAEFELEDGVMIFCTPWCPDCRRARAFLTNNKIAFTEVDITRNPAAARQVREWNAGKEITPTFYIRGQVLANFNTDALAKALGIQG